MTARTTLRAATRTAHERVDAAFASYDLATRETYAQFLLGQSAALLPIEDALGRDGAAALVEQWDQHRRAPLLLDDLAALGFIPPPPVTVPPFTDQAALVGGLYVIEGSRLGGAVLRRRVPGGLPATFLSARQAPGRWTSFIASLDRLLYSPQRLDAAIDAALGTFACFEQAARRMKTA